uniref:Triple QxxK/R motif-containing protein n=1 Tax=Paramormyrops kingsleyae TaxID=1676925 RepID=A0A3B3RV50_9TELE
MVGVESVGKTRNRITYSTRPPTELNSSVTGSTVIHPEAELRCDALAFWGVWSCSDLKLGDHRPRKRKRMGKKDASATTLPVDQYRKQIGKQDYKKSKSALRATRLKAEAKRNATGMRDTILVIVAVIVFLLSIYAFFYLNLSTEIDLDVDVD